MKEHSHGPYGLKIAKMLKTKKKGGGEATLLKSYV